MTEDQFAAAIQGTEEQRDVNARQVANGFVLSGSRRFIEPTTGALRVQQGFETVAVDATSAAASVVRFLETGRF